MQQAYQAIRSNKTNKANKLHRTTLGIIAVSAAAAIFNIGMYGATNIANTSEASALSYSTSEDVSFTLKPTLSIGLSSDSLTIDNLVPGTTNDSNTVSVTVSSNTPYGYVLSAGVGSNDTTSPYYNTSSLTHENTTISNVFSSVDTNASLDSLDTDNTWGYSTSTDGGTSWSTYSGLSHTETKPLLDISDPATPSTIDFKIAARSASTQASGTYNNVITFYAVGKPEPPDYMQDTATIKRKLTNVGDEMQVVDIRDNNVYWVTKQIDGSIWMTQNLDLCIGCDGVATLTSQNTDLNVSEGSAYNSSYKNVDGIITWTPSYYARTSRTSINGTSVTGWESDAYRPSSAEGGDVIVFTSDSSDNDIVYDSLADCVSAGHSVDSCTHYSIGNYYNWSAAIASNYSGDFSVKNATADKSICPAGWRMPAGIGTEYKNDGELGQLLYESGIITALSTNSYTNDGFNILRQAPLYFARDGYVYNSTLQERGGRGNFWTSTIGKGRDPSVSAYSLYFTKYGIYSIYTWNGYDRDLGFSVRCLVK